MNGYEKLEAIHSLLLEYLQDESHYKGDLWSAMYLIEEARETYLKEQTK